MAKTKEKSNPLESLQEILDEYEGAHSGARSGKDIMQAELVSTGSFFFDYKLGGGFRAGSWSKFYAPPECGKTSMALVWGKQWQDHFIKNGEHPFVVYINAEGRITKELLERSGINIDPEYFTVIDSNRGDFIYSMMEKLVLGNKKFRYFFIVDSSDALVLTDDLKKDFYESAKMAGGALMASAAGRRLSPIFNASGHHLFICSQVRDRMTPGGGKTSSGGHAPNFYSSLIGQIKKPWTDTIIFENPSDPKTKQIGRFCDIALEKTPNETSGQRVLIPIKYGLIGGIWRAYEGMMVAQELKIFDKKGAWFNLNEQWESELKPLVKELVKSFQGERNLRDYFDKNPELSEFCFQKKLILTPNETSIVKIELDEVEGSDGRVNAK